MNNQLNELKRDLFGGPGKRINNIRFFPGSDRDNGPSDYKTAISCAIKAVQKGNCEDIPLND